MPTWANVEEIIGRFNADAVKLGPQFTSIGAVHDSLNEQTASQGVGLLDPEALLQLFASMVDTAAQANQWSLDDMQAFLDRVGDAIRHTHTQGSGAAPWPLI